MLIKTKYFKSDRPEMLRFITNKPQISLEVGCREATHSKLLKEKLNIKETWGIEPEDNKDMILDVTHIRFFTIKTLKKMLNECGYEILKIDAISLGRIKLRKKIFNFLTNNKFKTLDVFQFGITAKKRVDI